MLWCETAGREPEDLETLAVFASQLARHGFDVGVHVDALPPGLSRNAQFDLAPLLREGAPARADRVALIAAHRLDDRTLIALRRRAEGGPLACAAFGSFGTRQAAIGATAKLSYVFGSDPDVVDLGTRNADAPLVPVRRRSDAPERPRLLVVSPETGDRAQAAALTALALSRGFRLAILTDGRAKHAWLAEHGYAIPVFQFGEILPAALAERVEICATFVPPNHNYRLGTLLANLAASGAALLDGTRGHALAATGDAFLRGPIDLVPLGAFVAEEILPNRAEIATVTQASALAASGAAAISALGEPAPRPARPRVAGRGIPPADIVFLPTNGVGLGHAQRCALIARHLDPDRPRPVFAAFPSCTRLIKGHGFDVMPLVTRSPDHAQKHENDLANFLRVRALASGARSLVFDGGYVFDSVYRTIVECGLAGIWIRRGLWQRAQDNSIALDREKAFARVIVPDEAFPELNQSYSRGEQLHAVGPTVQHLERDAARREALRAALSERFGTAFERLIVTQLGAGVAADRIAQIQAICGAVERRADALHLIVVWPTATVEPGWFGWARSRVVRTHHAAVLGLAADLSISAAGYNSFHEALYNAVPTIFIPQTGAFMDNQRARAEAARERGLAGSIEPHALMRLEREIARHLDDGEAEAVRARLAGLTLPEPGNARAAALIEEVTYGAAALDRAGVAHRPARHG